MIHQKGNKIDINFIVFNTNNNINTNSVNDALTIKTYSGTHGYGILDVAITMDNSRFASW